MATEVSPAVDGADAAAADGGEVLPPDLTCERLNIAERSLEIEAARHENENLGIAFCHIVPGDLARERTFKPHLVVTAGEPYHFGNPMPRRVRRVQPLHRENAGPRRRSSPGFGDRVDATTHVISKTSGAVSYSCGLSKCVRSPRELGTGFAVRQIGRLVCCRRPRRDDARRPRLGGSRSRTHRRAPA